MTSLPCLSELAELENLRCLEWLCSLVSRCSKYAIASEIKELAPNETTAVKMTSSTRRIFFNTTGLPGLRLQRTYFQHARMVVRLTGRNPNMGNTRRVSTIMGEDESGHIAAYKDEGILFFDNLFPLRLNWIFQVPFRTDRNLPDLLWRFNNAKLGIMDPITLVKRAIPDSVPLKVTEIVPRLKDGGVFIKFKHEDGITVQEIEALVRGYLKEHAIKPWFNPFGRVRTSLVRGVPWLEDLYRFPTSRLKVEFVPTTPAGEAAELSQEILYSLFRKYGKLAEITSQQSDSKILPKFACLDFGGIRYAIMARNCMHGFKVLEEAGGGKAGTQLRISYEQKLKAHLIREWVVNHPRVFIPIVAALVAAITVAIFDPIRTFFVKAHVQHSFDVKDSRIYKWFMNQANDLFTFRRRSSDEASLNAIWDDRKAAIEQLQTWLMETADTFIVVQGPRGSGKKELVIDQALKGRKNVLLIDCKPIQEAHGDSATINAAAAEVGYRPVFSWMNSISSLIDLAAQGTIGVKSGFSETLDSQLAKIWQNTATALKRIALEGRSKKDKDASLSDDDFLEAHPERRPVVIIDNFLHKNEESGIVYDKIAEWAASLTSANIAHVMFLTNEISYSKSLSKALPDRVFRQLALGDITPQVAKKFVITHLDSQDDPSGGTAKLSTAKRREDLNELDECIETLGGRLTDLEFLARRLKTGQSPNKAIQEIIEQSASEILKMYLITAANGDRKWSAEQAWYLVKALAETDQLRYNEVLLSNTFTSSTTPMAANGEAVLDALSQAELISIKSVNGRLESIKPGKPVYKSAFKRLTEDRVLMARLDLAILIELTKIESKNIDKYETELSALANLPNQPWEIQPRIQYLLTKLNDSQRKVEAWEREMGALKQILTIEY